MRFKGVLLAAACGLTPLLPAYAAAPSTFTAAPALELAQGDAAGTADDERRIEEDERKLRERKRALRERRRGDREDLRPAVLPRAWVSVGAGAAAGTVKYPCDASNTSNDCSGAGTFGTYSANATITGPYSALRVRGIREMDRDGNRHVPYEEAVLIGSRFGRSDWYGLAGYGRVVHPDDKHPDDTHGFAWDIVYAPSSLALTGIELSFQGDLGPDVEFFGVGVGMRFGVLR